MVIQPLYNHKVPQPKSRKPGYLGTVLINAVLFVVAYKILDWDIPQITDKWAELLPLLSVSFIATMACYLALLVYDPPRLYFAVRTALDALSICIGYRLFTVYPFNFSTLGPLWLDDAARYVILASIVITVIAVVVRAVRLALGKNVYY